MIAHNLVNAILKRNQWNDAHKPGCYVRFWQSMPAGQWMISRTSSEAFIHGNGVAVCVIGTVMPVYLSNLEAVSQETIAVILNQTWRRRRRRRRSIDRVLPVGDRGG